MVLDLELLTLIRLWGEGALDVAPEPQGPHESRYLKLDSSDARSELGWEPRWDLEQALAATVSWYRAFQGGTAMRGFSCAQIASYCAV